MNIGISLLAFVPCVSGGIGFYITNLIRSLQEIDSVNNYYLITNTENENLINPINRNFSVIKTGLSSRPQIRRVAWEQVFLPIFARRLNLDVLHCPSYTVPIFCRTARVVTICDMLYKDYPQTLGISKRIFWRLLVPISAKLSKRVLTISANSKSHIVRYLRIPEEKVIVTHLALDQGFENALPVDGDGVSVVCRKYSIRRPYVLSVGAIGGHKNPRCLIEALTLLRRRSGTETTSLVLTGNDYGAKQEIIAAARALNVDGSVNMPGYIARHDLPALYKGALSYVSLSLYEGFGLTLLEAMACGVPVVASNQASLPEVAGDAVALVSPHNAAQVADALYELAMNDKYREELILRGYSRVKDFSWEATAKGTLRSYEDAATMCRL